MDPSLPALPDPLTNLLQEIQFRRLLHVCHTQINALAHANGSNGQPGSAQQEAVPTAQDMQAAKLKHYIETLQEQLDELERNHALELGFKTLSAYRQHVAALVARTPKVVLPLYCQKPRPPAPPVAAAAPASTSGRGSAGPPKLFVPGLPGGGSALESVPETAESHQQGGSIALSDAARKRLEHHEQLHESLTERLGELVGVVKENALGAQTKVEERGKLVDAAEVGIDQNLTKAKSVVAKSKDQYKRSRGTFCLTLGILLLVGMIFTAMLVYIKFTHLLGYRARPAPPSPLRYSTEL